MRSFIIPALLPFAFAAPLEKRDPAQPTLFTFTYDGALVTATYYGTSSAPPAPCPTMTFTVSGAVVTAPYEGPGTPQSCLTNTATAAAAACPTMTFEYAGAVITQPYTGPGKLSCLQLSPL